jgi:hypothetical protein
MSDEPEPQIRPCVGDRILLTRPLPPEGEVEVWQRRREVPSLVIDVGGDHVWSMLTPVHATDRPWTAPIADVAVVGRAVYTATGLERAQRLVEAEATARNLTAEVVLLHEMLAEAEYRAELAEEAARTVTDLYPLNRYLPGDAEPEFVGGEGTRLTIMVGLGSGRLFIQRLSDEWRTTDTPLTVYRWEQILSEGPLLDLTPTPAAKRMFEAFDAERAHNHEVRSALWEFERDCLSWRLTQLGLQPDREPTGSVAEARAILRTAQHAMAKMRMPEPVEQPG